MVLVDQDVVVVALELGPDRLIALEEEHRLHDQVAEVYAPRHGLEFLAARVDPGNLFGLLSSFDGGRLSRRRAHRLSQGEVGLRPDDLVLGTGDRGQDVGSSLRWVVEVSVVRQAEPRKLDLEELNSLGTVH